MGFVPWSKALELSKQLDSLAGAPCRMVANLIRAGFWRRVEGGFQILALAKTGIRSPQEIDIEAKRLNSDANLTPTDRHFLLAEFIYGRQSH